MKPAHKDYKVKQKNRYSNRSNQKKEEKENKGEIEYV